MYAICEYPNVFGGAICMSTHWPGTFTTDNNPMPNAFAKYMREHLPNPKNHKMYFDYGDQTLDAMYPPLQKNIDIVIKAKGFTNKNWMTKFSPGDNHSEVSWNKRLPIAIQFLFGKQFYSKEIQELKKQALTACFFNFMEFLKYTYKTVEFPQSPPHLVRMQFNAGYMKIKDLR